MPENAAKFPWEAYNHLNQTYNLTCNLGHEYTDALGVGAIGTATTDDDHIATVRTKDCDFVAHPNGGEWHDPDPIPDKCWSEFNDILGHIIK